MANLQLDAILKLIDVNINPSVFKKISQATAGMPKNLQLTVKATNQVNTSMGRVRKSVDATSKSMVGMNRVARQFLQRMAQFAILLPTFATLNRSIQGGVKFLADFESELAKIVRINPDQLRGKMESIADAALDIAREFGSTGDAVIGSIRIFKQAGETIEESIDKARVATLGATVTTLDLAGAQELLISVSKQFAQEGLTNAQVLDKVTKVEDSAAVGAQDLAEALKTGGNALSFASKSFDDTLGLIAGLREQTRKSGREIGTFFKTLSTRIFAAGESRTAIESLGISVENVDGSLRPLLPVLQELAVRFDGLTESESANAAKSIAGVRQFESLIATLKSLNRAQELSTTVADAQGTAQKQLAITAETLNAKVNQMISGFQKLAQTSGESGLLDIFKDAVDFAGNIATALEAAVGFADKLGVAIGPLLAVGTLQLGKKAFGAGGVGGEGASLGAASNQAAVAVTAFANATAKAGQVIGVSATKTAQIQAQQSRKSAAALTGVVIAGGLIANVFDLAADAVAEGEGIQRKYNAELLRGAGSALQIGTSFALISPKLGLLAGALTFAISSINDLSKAANDAKKAREEELDILKQGTAAATLRATGSERGLFDDFVNIIEQELVASGGKLTGGGLSNIKKEFDKAVSGFDDLKDLDIASVIASPELLKQIGGFNSDLTNLNQAITDGAAGTRLFGELIKDLASNVGFAETEFGDLLETMISTADSVSRIKELRGFAQLEAEIIDQRLELMSVTQSQVQLFSSEIALRQKALSESKNFISVADQTVSRLKSLASSAPLENLGKPREVAEQFIADLEEGFASAGPDVQGFLTNLLSSDSLSGQQKSFGKEFISALKARRDEEIKIETAAFEVRKAIAQEEFDRQQALRDISDQTTAVFDSLKQSLIGLGVGAEATASDLNALQGLSSDEFRSVLSGTSDLGDNIKNAINALSGDEVARAEAKIAQASQSAAVELQALQQQLDTTQTALSDIKDGFNQSTGKSEIDLIREAGELRSAIAEKQGQTEIELAKLGIERASAVKEAEDEAAEKARELQEALRALAEAEKSVAAEAKEVNRAFEDFVSSKVGDFASADADAQNELKQAEQDVLAATDELADSYANLNQAILDFNDNAASAVIESNLLGVQIQQISGGLSTFQSRLGALDSAFNSVLNDANISLQQRIDLERQLAEETLSFLSQAKAEIVGAGLEVFGQTGEENRALDEGIKGLQFVADQLGGSFENFLDIDPGDFNKLSNELLNLPVEFRQNILGALDTLPDSVNVGGFSVEELRTAIGQVGAGIAPEEGLPSVEELIEAETAQIEELRDLAIKDAELQFASVVAAQEELELSKAQLEEAEIMRERAEENAVSVREAILEEKAVLDAANEQRQLLTEQVLAATSEAALEQIQAQAEKFAEQNSVFREIGDQITGSIESLAAVQGQALAAAAAVPSAYGGHIPNFSRGNLTSREIGGLIRAASIEKRHMPGSAGLAVANTSETIIPARHRGQIPNFQDGNLSEIGAGINAVKGINETVVAAISRSVGEALSDIVGQGNDEGNREVVDSLGRILDQLEDISASNTTVASNTETTETDGNAPRGNAADLRVDINMNQNDTVQVTGLDGLVGELETGIRNAQDQQAGVAVEQLEGVVTEIAQVLRERGLVSSLGQPG